MGKEMQQKAVMSGKGLCKHSKQRWAFWNTEISRLEAGILKIQLTFGDSVKFVNLAPVSQV